MAALRLLLVAALLALPLWVARSTPGHAYICVVGEGIPDPLVSANLIVVGTVGEMLVLPPESVEHPETLRDGRLPVEIKFNVSDYIKGSGPQTLLIYQATRVFTDNTGRIERVFGYTDGDTSFTLGDEYVLVLRKSDSLRYTTDVCSGNIRITGGQDVSGYIADIRATLARGPSLPSTGSGPPHHGPPVVPLIAAAALAGLGLAANAAFALRRRS